MKALSKFISYLFHPLLFPTYGTVLILALNPNMFGYFGEKLHVVWLIIVFALTFIFPVVWVAMMKGLGMIESLNMETSKERIIPFVAAGTFYLWTTWMFRANVHMKIPLNNPLIFYMMIGACISLFVAFFMNSFTKISLHTLGAGSIMGLILILIKFSTYDIRLLFVVIVVLAGIIGTARLILKAHTEPQIWMGYFIGFTGQFLAFNVVSKLIN